MASNDPIDNIEWVAAESLRANHWNPNRVMTAEVMLLERSLLALGWIQPVLANRSGLIIDGFHRWRLSQDSPKVRRRWGGAVPVAYLDIPDDEAMATTVRINRAKGHHTGQGMSQLVRDLINVYGWTPEKVGQEIGADDVEVAHLALEDVFEMKGTKDHAYSAAWYPTGTPTSMQGDDDGIAEEEDGR